jgi:hypothetical protein
MPLSPLDVYGVIEAEARRRGLLKSGHAAPLPLLEREAARRGLVRFNTFHDYVYAVNPGLLKYEHVPKLIDVGERVIAGLLSRVLILLPPRYFKTEIFGKLLSGAYLHRHPTRAVGLTSYSADRAWEVSEAAQRYFVQTHGRLRDDVQAKKHWVTQSGGEMWAVGMGGAILGRGFHFGNVDDPIHPAQARSVIYQRRFARWWPETWLSRQEPTIDGRAQIAFVMQRLGPEDPIDYLFRREVGENEEEAPQHWHVVALDEIHSGEQLGRWNGPLGLPPTCTLEPDDRPIGRVLSPARFSEKAVKAAQKSAGPLTAASQRQQRPLAPTGDFWQSKWFVGREYKVRPAEAYNGGRDWDTAQTKEEANSACAWVESYRGPSKPRQPGEPDEFEIYIEDVDWDWLEFPALVKKMRELKGPHYVEAKSSGKSAVQSLAAYGIRAVEVTVLGDKLARAAAVQPAVSNGRVWVSAKASKKLLWGERQGLLRVTAEALQVGAQGLDLNDAFVQALTRHLGIGAPAEKKLKFR